MQRFYFLTLLLNLSFSAPVFAQQSISGNFTSSGNTRSYIGALPNNPQTPLRLVILFCGFSEDAAEMEKRHFNDYLGNNTMVVYPEPLNMGGVFSADTLTQDLMMVEDLISHISTNYTINMNDLCVGGFSAGADFTYELVCEYNQVGSTRPYSFKALAVVAGSMDTTEATRAHCNIAGELPLIAFHGTNDQFVNYDGVTIFSNGQSVDTVYRSPVDSTLNFWAKTINGCNANPSLTTLPDLVVEPQVPSTVEKLEYNCANCANTTLYRIVGGLHNWPTSDATWDNLFGGHNEDIIASQLIADFFNCSSALSTSGLNPDPNNVSLYPNPFQDQLSIETNAKLISIQIYSASGQKIIESAEQSKSIHLGDIKPGVYTVRIETDMGMTVERIVKK